MHRVWTACFGVAFSVVVAACSSDESNGHTPDSGTCEEGSTRACTGSCPGMQTCENGVWSACVCDEGSDGGGADSGSPIACQAGVWPEKPAITGAGGSRRFVAALSELTFGDENSVVGFDLDARGSPSGCTAPDPGDVSPIPEGCAIDNSLGHMLTTDDVVHADELTALVAKGVTTLLVRVREFTGTTDDDAVSVDLLIGAPFDEFGETEKPAFDGTDAWPVSSRSADLEAPAPLNAPLYTSDEAFISSGRLAAHFNRALVRLPMGMSGIPARAFDMPLENVSLVCSVAEVESQVWRLDDCTLGGLWITRDLLAQLPESVDQLDPPNPLCKDALGYEVLKEYFCRFTSRAAAGAAACNALSVGIRFQTVPALASNVFQIEPRASACEPGSDPADDACASSSP